MNGKTQAGVPREQDDCGTANDGDWLPTGCAEHVKSLIEARDEARSERDHYRTLYEEGLGLARKLRGDIAKCYAARPATRTGDAVALRELADRILEEVKLALQEEGWNVVSDDPDDEEEEDSDDSEERGY